MRIINIVDTLDPNSGVFSVLYSFHKELIKYGVQVDYIYLKETELSLKEELVSLNSKILKINISELFSGTKAKNELREFTSVKDSRKVIVHNHILLFSNILMPIIRKNKNVITIGHAHSSELSNHPVKIFRNRIMITGINRHYDNKWGCSSNAVKCWFGEKTVKNNDYNIVYNPVDYSLIKKISNQPTIRIERDFISLVTVGRLSKEKNQIFLINLVEMLMENGIAVKLSIIGEGSEEENLLDHIRLLGLSDYIKIYGYMPKEELFEELKEYDYFLFPSNNEGLGTALIEAQMLGVKCYANNNLPIESDLGLVKYLNNSLSEWANTIINDVNNENEDDKFTNFHLVGDEKYYLENSSSDLYSKYLHLNNRKQSDN